MLEAQKTETFEPSSYTVKRPDEISFSFQYNNPRNTNEG